MKKSTKRHFKLSTISALIASACFLVAILSLMFPYARKSDSIKITANTAIERLESMAVSYAVLIGDELKSLSESPTSYPQHYQRVSISLSKISERLGYKRLAIVNKKGNKIVAIGDSKYKVGGDEHLAPGAELPNSIYKNSSTTISKVLDGKSSAGYSSGLLTNAMGGYFVATYLPIKDNNGEVLAVLVADCDVGTTAYNMVGFLDLNLVGIVALLVGMAFAGITYLSTRFRVVKEQAESEPKPSATHKHIAPKAVATEAKAVDNEKLSDITTEQLPKDNIDDNLV